MFELTPLLQKAKACARRFGGATLGREKKNAVLRAFADYLVKDKERIFTANQKDVAEARAKDYSSPYINRLAFTDKIFADLLHQLDVVGELPDPISEVIETRELADGVRLERVRVPLGVIGIIYESRPNITVDVAALCIKSGNVCVLKGGSAAHETNRALVAALHAGLQREGVSQELVTFLDTTDRSVVSSLVRQNDYLDVIIPRGGYELVRTVVEEATVPVLYHAEGGARIYVDESADFSMALLICVNAKTNRPATCNSLDTVVVHEKIAAQFLPRLVETMQREGVAVLGDDRAREIVAVKEARASDYSTEFLDLIMSLKVVKNVEEAIEFIAARTKRHSEGIVAEDEGVIKRFVGAIDAAAVFVNCSTRLHDGGIFGMGAEMGIATGKLHARGPVGLRELTTYKWVAYGHGQVRGTYD